jgi:zinc transport system substrate-binding protein
MNHQKISSLLLAASFLFPSGVYADDVTNVFVSILPQQYFVQQVGNGHVDVHVMVGPGQNPATYEPTPQQMAALSNADVYFRIGVPFESAWLDKIKLNNKELIVIDCCEAFSNIENDEHSHKHDTIYDPHIWTSPVKVIRISELIEKTLSRLDPEHNASYKSAANLFIDKLQKLDELIKIKTNKLRKRDLIVSHPSWSYFSEQYGFKQISIEQQGKEIQASSMVKLIELAKDRDIKAVFVQPQFNDKAAKTIANELKANIFVLDPLAYDYLENMDSVVNEIVKGLADE